MRTGTNSPPSPPANSRLQGLSPAAIRNVVAAAHALDLGRAGEAERIIIGLLALHPDHAEVLRLAAGLHTLRGDHVQAVATLRQALAQRPGDALCHTTLGAALIELGDYDAAIATLQRACELDETLVSAWFNLGLACMRCMRVDEAAAALRRAVELSPTESTARVILADMLRAQARDDEAVAEYRRVIAQNAQAGMAWWGLADMKSQRLRDDDLARLRAAMARPGARESDLVAMGFALAVALDNRDRFAEAFAVLAETHARARRNRPWNADACGGLVDAVISAFDPAPSGAPDDFGNEVIFIASLPRSGSTLVEQILAAHSQVEGAGELPDVPAVLTEESRRRNRAFPEWVKEAEPADWVRLGRRYLERTAHWRTHRRRFTDKLPYNWIYAGAIRAMLPGARIVLARRDALETCWSCYRQHLAGNNYTHAFADLARFLRDFERTATHWTALHPARVRMHSYESLIADPEGEIRALLTFCDLPFEPACVDFHEARREVHTPSAVQVRQPLRRDTARAVRYGHLLDPLRAALALPPLASGKG